MFSDGIAVGIFFPQIYLWLGIENRRVFETQPTDKSVGKWQGKPLFLSLKFSKSMVATIEQEAPTVMATDLAARKLRLIELILGIEEESALLEIEGIVFDFSEDEEDASDEEIAFVAERIAEAKANPDAGIPFEQFMQNMKNRLRQ